MEIRKTLDKSSIIAAENSKLPAALKGLKQGDSIVIKSKSELKKSKFPEDSIIYELSGLEIQVDYEIYSINDGEEYPFTLSLDEIIEVIGKKVSPSDSDKSEEVTKYDDDFEEDGTEIVIKLPISAFKLVKEDSVSEDVEFSLDNDYTDEDIKEMKSLLSEDDIVRLKKMFNIPMNKYHKGKPISVAEGVFDKFIDDWAKNKYPLFKLMGRKLKIEKDISFDMDELEMGELVSSLIQSYPKYGLMLELFSKKDFIENSISIVPENIKKYFPDLKPKEKLSGFFAKFDDDKFSNDVSKIMQNRKINGKMVLSIDPYDYLTSSTTAHGWGTCHSLLSEHYPTGQFAFMIDNSTIVAYRTNGETYNYSKGTYRSDSGAVYYDYKNNAFEGNSKSFRQYINIDTNTCSILFGRQYPKKIKVEGAEEFIKDFVKDLFLNYFGKDMKNEWDNYGEETSFYKAKDTQLYYSDNKNIKSLRSSDPNAKFEVITPLNTNHTKISISDGVETMICFKCGESHKQNRVLCKNCSN